MILRAAVTGKIVSAEGWVKKRLEFVYLSGCMKCSILFSTVFLTVCLVLAPHFLIL